MNTSWATEKIDSTPFSTRGLITEQTNRSIFFENRRNKISQLNANLSNSVKEQHKSSQAIAWAAKYARIWLEKVRQRKANRLMAAQGGISL